MKSKGNTVSLSLYCTVLYWRRTQIESVSLSIPSISVASAVEPDFKMEQYSIRIWTRWHRPVESFDEPKVQSQPTQPDAVIPMVPPTSFLPHF